MLVLQLLNPRKWLASSTQWEWLKLLRLTERGQCCICLDPSLTWTQRITLAMDQGALSRWHPLLMASEMTLQVEKFKFLPDFRTVFLPRPTQNLVSMPRARLAFSERLLLLKCEPVKTSGFLSELEDLNKMSPSAAYLSLCLYYGLLLFFFLLLCIWLSLS